MTSDDAVRAILEVSDALAGDVDFEAALSLVADAALALTGASHASVRLLAAGEGVLLATARAGEGVATAPKLFRRGEGLMGWVVERGRGLVVPDVRADEPYREVPGQGFPIGAMVLEPLIVGGVVGGVLSASSPRVDAFGDAAVLAFKLLARCTQFPLERARLQRLAVVDQLTLALAPSTLDPSLLRALDDARKSGRPFSLLFFDLDRFKGVNDRYGQSPRRWASRPGTGRRAERTSSGAPTRRSTPRRRSAAFARASREAAEAPQKRTVTSSEAPVTPTAGVNETDGGDGAPGLGSCS
jgi:GAF domain-containing protein